MARKLRIGIAGFGGIGHLHAAIYQNLPHCELVAVADCDPAKLASESGDINFGLPTRVELAPLRRYEGRDGTVFPPEEKVHAVL